MREKREGFRLLGVAVPLSLFFGLWGNLSGFLEAWVVLVGAAACAGLSLKLL